MGSSQVLGVWFPGTHGAGSGQELRSLFPRHQLMGFKAAGGHPVPLCQVAQGQMHINRANIRTGMFAAVLLGRDTNKILGTTGVTKRLGFGVLSLALRARSAFSYCSCKNGACL